MLLAVFSVIVAPRLQARFGSPGVLGGSLVLLAVDVLVLGYGNHTAPYFAPKIEEWTGLHVPFVVAAVTAVLGALVIVVRRRALAHEAEDGVRVFAN